MLSKNKKQVLQNKILLWYAKNKRNLPWRKTTDPYKILVSEVMLQQTQVDRVIGYYTPFLKQFPTLQALAAAEKPQLLALWSGLGYNNRVLRLQQLAQTVMTQQQGIFPQTEEALQQLPGIGPYTARAVLAFAFNKPVPVIDTNIRRVLIHELKLQEKIDMNELEKIAQQCIPEQQSRLWHNALMDYGALEMTAKKTGIKPLSKQPTFEGSDRQVRGHIIKQLLQKKMMSIKQLKQQFQQKNITAIVEKMEADGLIVREKQNVGLQR